jgi:hypothetical protein
MSQSLETPLMVRMAPADVAKIEQWGRARGLGRSAALRALVARGLDSAAVETTVAAATREAAGRTIVDVLYATIPALLTRTAGLAAGATPEEVAERIRAQQTQIRQWIVDAGVPEAALLPPEPTSA